MSQIFTIPQFLSEKECADIIEKCKRELILKQAKIGRDQNPNSNRRKSSVAFIEDLGPINARLQNTLKDYVKVKGCIISKIEAFQFTEYQIGEYYKWHEDSATQDPIFSKRYYSTVIQLNNHYTEGELQVIENKEVVTLKKGLGSLYMFPSYFTHRVKPIATGTRYSLVNWINFQKNVNVSRTLI